MELHSEAELLKIRTAQNERPRLLGVLPLNFTPIGVSPFSVINLTVDQLLWDYGSEIWGYMFILSGLDFQ